MISEVLGGRNLHSDSPDLILILHNSNRVLTLKIEHKYPLNRKVKSLSHLRK